MGHLLSLVEALQRRAAWKSEKKKVVFTNGCFDLLHVGHVRYLEAARAMGDVLIVGVNSDRSVSVIKGPKRPILPEAERAELLAGLTCVDATVVFDEPDPLALITALKPDVLVKGGDWAVDQIIGREVVEAGGGEVKAVPVVPGRSTSSIIDAVLKNLKS